MTLLHSILFAVYLLGGIAIYFKFCHNRHDISRSERFWSLTFWPLLVLATMMFILGLMAAVYAEDEQEDNDLPA